MVLLLSVAGWHLQIYSVQLKCKNPLKTRVIPQPWKRTMLITNENYFKALRQLKQTYAELPWYQRFWFNLWSYSLSNALSAIDLNNPTTEQVDDLLKASDEAWFFNSIFKLLDVFKNAIQGIGFQERFIAKGQYSGLLPEELLWQIGHHLPSHNLQELRGTSRANYSLFQPMINVRQFLSDVVHGEYGQVEARLMNNINFLTPKGRVTDYSGRSFFDISGFQYALWALDKHMWTRMLNCLPLNKEGAEVKKALLNQYEELKENGVTYELNGKIITEQHFDFENTLIKELQIQVNDANNGIKSWDEINQQWREGVGSAQKLLPMHVVYEYCSDKPFHPLPAFSEQPSLKKQFYNWISNKFEEWFHSESRLGGDFAIFKGRRGAGVGGRGCGPGAGVRSRFVGH